jgi:hypothetical protein
MELLNEVKKSILKLKKIQWKTRDNDNGCHNVNLVGKYYSIKVME